MSLSCDQMNGIPECVQWINSRDPMTEIHSSYKTDLLTDLPGMCVWNVHITDCSQERSHYWWDRRRPTSSIQVTPPFLIFPNGNISIFTQIWSLRVCMEWAPCPDDDTEKETDHQRHCDTHLDFSFPFLYKSNITMTEFDRERQFLYLQICYLLNQINKKRETYNKS